jgi:NAD(P) transhydrogenase subunit alpha
MAHVASDLYGTNLAHFLDEMGGASKFKVDHENDAVRPALVLEGGDKRWPAPPMKKAEPAPAKAPEAKAPPKAVDKPHVSTPHKSHGPAARPPSSALGLVMALVGLAAAGLFIYLRVEAPVVVAGNEGTGGYQLLQHITVFVMAIFVGMQVIWNVTPALHTPLMSVTNAISGIIVIGGLLGAIGGDLKPSVAVAVAATLFATINVAGGFLVTRRMLAMFRK